MAHISAPLWLMNAISPFRAIWLANDAFRPVGGTIAPRQLGPMMRMLYLRASSRQAFSRAAPSLPTSLKPAEMMMMPRTPAFPHSVTEPKTRLAGMQMMARSTCSGTSPMVL